MTEGVTRVIEDVFVLDEKKTEEAVISGEDVEVYESQYGWNDDLVNWLKKTGFWDILTSMQPDKKDNGINPSVLNGVWVVMDIAHMGRIQKVDPVLRDGRIMHEVGFNIHRVHERLKAEKGIIHRDTLRNHIKRISTCESQEAFYRLVVHMRKKRLIRGRVYAADGFEIEVASPDSYEGCGKRWDPKKGRVVYGYKVGFLFNVADDRPRIVGIAVGPINMDERVLLCEILDALSVHVAPVSQIIDTLVLDRGYWGVGFFADLRGKYRVHIVTLGKADLSACEDVRALVKFEKRTPTVLRVKKKNNRGKTLAFTRELVPVQDVEVVGENGESLKMNAVFMREIKESTGEVEETIFFTTLSVARAPQRIVAYYDSRWNIENRCNRTLSQTWKMRTLTSRKLSAICAQIAMVAMCYNVCRIYEEKNPREAEETRAKMQERAIESFLVDYGTIVFVPRLRVFAAMRAVRYADLRSKRMAVSVLSLTKQGLSLEEAIEQTVGKVT